MASRTAQRLAAQHAASWAALAKMDPRKVKVDRRAELKAALRSLERELLPLAAPRWMRTPYEVCQITLIGETGRDFKDFVPGWSQHAADVLGPRPDNSDPPAWRLALLAALAAEALRLPKIPDALYERFLREYERHGAAAAYEQSARGRVQHANAGSSPKKKPLIWEHTLAYISANPGATVREVWETFPMYSKVKEETEVPPYRVGPGCDYGEPPADEAELKKQLLTEVIDKTGKLRRPLTYRAFEKYVTDAKKQGLIPH